MLGFILTLLAFAGDSPAYTPEFTKDGQLVRPADYREWIFLSSGLGMSYSPAIADSSRPTVFDNVFVHPAAYKAFLKTGKWPDKTVFVLEIRGSGSNESINKRGQFQKELVAVEVELKDEARFPDKWAFFGFPVSGGQPAATGKVFPKATCNSCHSANGAVENTFVQFYPTLLEVAEKNGTLKESFRKSPAAH